MVISKSKRGKYVFLLLRIAVVVCGIIWGIFWVSRGQRWTNLRRTFLRIDLWVFAATLGIFIFGQIIIGLRWWLLLRTQSVFIKFWVAVRLHFLGLFYNNFMPSSVGGDLVRAWYVSRHTDRRFEAVLSVFVDRLIGLLSTLIIAAFFYTLFFRGHSDVIRFGKWGGFLSVVAEHGWFLFWLVVGVAVVFLLLSLHGRTRGLLLRGWSYFRMLGIRGFRKLKNAIIIYCSRPLTILVVFGLTVFLQILTITGFWFLGRDMGITADIKYYYVFFTLTWVAGAVPVSIGGAVVVEVLLATLFVRFAGVGEEAAGALALCQRAVWMLASLPGAVIHLLGAHLPKDFSIDYDESIN